jgi:hypothetical protein
VRVAWMLGCVLMAGLSGCSDKTNARVATKLNQDAMLVGNLPANPLQGKVITSWIDKRNATMSTMFGNDVAVQNARTKAVVPYPVGAVLSVVTWGQQEDPRWFGGNIPKGVKAVEFVTVTAAGAYSYQRFEGSPLKKVASVEGSDPTDRAGFLMAQRAAVMP